MKPPSEQSGDCDSQIKLIPLRWDKLPVDVAVGSCFLNVHQLPLQGGDGSTEPECLDSRQETEILQAEEDPKLTTSGQVSLGMDQLSLTAEMEPVSPWW